MKLLVLLYLLKDKNMNDWIINLAWSILALAITTPISLWLTTLTPLRFRLLVIRILSPLSNLKRKEFKVAGLWDARYVKGDDINNHSDICGYHQYRIYQFGNIVVGQAINEDSNAIVYGELKKHNVFDGMYYDPRDGVEYHGTFQVIFNENTKKMRGKWIGFDNETHSDINSGVWEWKPLISKSL